MVQIRRFISPWSGGKHNIFTLICSGLFLRIVVNLPWRQHPQFQIVASSATQAQCLGSHRTLVGRWDCRSAHTWWHPGKSRHGNYTQILLKLLTHWTVWKILKDIFTFSITSWILFNRRRPDSQCSKHTCCLLHTVNIIPADALAKLGAKASAGVVLTPNLKPEYFVSSIRRVRYSKQVTNFIHKSIHADKQ